MKKDRKKAKAALQLSLPTFQGILHASFPLLVSPITSLSVLLQPFQDGRAFKNAARCPHDRDKKKKPLIPDTGTKCSTKFMSKAQQEQAPHSTRKEKLRPNLKSHSPLKILTPRSTPSCQSSSRVGETFKNCDSGLSKQQQHSYHASCTSGHNRSRARWQLNTRAGSKSSRNPSISLTKIARFPPARRPARLDALRIPNIQTCGSRTERHWAVRDQSHWWGTVRTRSLVIRLPLQFSQLEGIGVSPSFGRHPPLGQRNLKV